MNEIERWVNEIVESDDPNAHAQIFADWLEERGDKRHEAIRNERFNTRGKQRIRSSLISCLVKPELDGPNWPEVFYYADGGDGCEADGKAITKAIPGSDVSTQGFTRLNVVEILASSEGENDESNWLIGGKLDDGRYFFISAGCDYSGWG